MNQGEKGFDLPKVSGEMPKKGEELSKERQEMHRRLKIVSERLKKDMMPDKLISEAEKLVAEGILVNSEYATGSVSITNYFVQPGDNRLTRVVAFEVRYVPDFNTGQGELFSGFTLSRYDDNGNTVEIVERAADNSLEKSIKHEYHPNGKKSRTEVLDYTPGKNIQSIYEYDETGKRTNEEENSIKR